MKNVRILLTSRLSFSSLSPIHDRMPAVLGPEVFDLWLDTTASLDQAKALLEP